MDSIEAISIGNYVRWLVAKLRESRKSVSISQIGGEWFPSRYMGHIIAHRSKEVIFFMFLSHPLRTKEGLFLKYLSHIRAHRSKEVIFLMCLSHPLRTKEGLFLKFLSHKVQ